MIPRPGVLRRRGEGGLRRDHLIELTQVVEGDPGLRQVMRLMAPATNLKQEIYVSNELPQTQRIMVKDEDVCLHCGLCAERCPTAAWDMRRFDLGIPYAGKPVPQHLVPST